MEIPDVVNTLNKIHLSTNIFSEFNSTYYDDKNHGFGLLIIHYTYSFINNIKIPNLN